MKNIFLSSLVIDTLKASNLNCSFYEKLIIDTENKYPPPYSEKWYGEAYRTLAMNPSWLAGSLLANAYKEGDGATQLKMLVYKTPANDKNTFNQICKHAQDEARHARVFLILLKKAFPNADISQELLTDIQNVIPNDDILNDKIECSISAFIDEICQINIGEIRTKIHQLLLEPIICEHAKYHGSHKEVSKMMKQLIHDEGKHITYTAEIIEKYAKNPEYTEFIQNIFKQRFDIFNQITLHEIDAQEVCL